MNAPNRHLQNSWGKSKWELHKHATSYLEQIQPHSRKQQLNCHLPLISKNIQVWRTRHKGHNWRSKVELISDVPLWTPIDRHTSVGRPANNYLQQLRVDTGCILEELPGTLGDRDEWKERERKSAKSVHSASTWWWRGGEGWLEKNVNMNVQ